MKVFYSWESDLNHETHLKFIRESLRKSIELVGGDLGLDEAERPELEEASSNRKGAENIVADIHRKIEHAAIFVADVTPVATSERQRLLPNPNVLYELGWATGKIGYDRVILVMNDAEGYQIKDMPFDLVQRPIITYTLKAKSTERQKTKAQDRLVKDLTHAIKTNLVGFMEQELEIPKRSSEPDDPSIWTKKGIIVRGYYGQNRTLTIPSLPRAYLRITPARWNNGIPDADAFLKAPETMRVEQCPASGLSGDFGKTTDGAVRYWMTEKTAPETPRSNNLAHFFDANGEIWMIAGTLWKAQRGISIDLPSTLKAWAKALAAATAFMDQNGASKLRFVELGASKLLHVHLPTNGGYDSVQSVKEDVRVTRQSTDWDESAQQALILEAFNELRSAFGFNRATSADLQKLVAA